MKLTKNLICLLFAIYPVILSAINVRTDKCWLLSEASKHRELARTSLDRLNSRTWWIPDFGKQSHLRNIISSSAASVFVPGARQKVLTVGIVLITGLIDDITGKYFDMRDDLIDATHHLESCYFFGNLSLRYPCTCNFPNTAFRAPYNYEASKAYLQAIDNFTCCSMLASCIKDLENQSIVLDYMQNILDVVYEEFNNGKAGFQKRITCKVKLEYEDLNKFMDSYLHDNRLQHWFRIYFGAALDYVQYAEKYWIE